MDSVSLYLLVPVMGIIGVVNMASSNIPFMAEVSKGLHFFPQQMLLPIVLCAYFIIVTGQSFIKRQQTILNSVIQQRFIKQLRIETYRTIMESDWLFFVHRRKADFSSVLTTELARVSQGTIQTLNLVTSVAFTLIQIAFAMVLSWQLTLIVIFCGLAFAYFSRHFVRKAKTLGNSTTELSMDYLAGVNEHFNGIKDIKSNGLESSHLSWFQIICRQMERNVVKFATLQATSQIRYSLVSSFLIVTFVYLSIDIFNVTAGQMMLILLIFGRLWPRFSGLQGTIEQIAMSIPAFSKLLDIRTACEQAKEPWNNMDAELPMPMPIRESITCKHISFRYDNEQSSYALRDVSLTIPVNSMVAIVGKSGAGKSTLIDLIIGLLTPNQGEVLIDGKPLEDQNIPSYRQTISYVSQEPFLFNTSLRENMKLVKPHVSDTEIWHALHFAASAEFVKNLPSGLDTVIGDRGVRLSGGERQRIVLARAILRKPTVLILDEATSSLDNENEAIIQTALERLKGNMTIIVIAHRLSTIRNADQVLVLDKGEVIQQGAYAQLASETKGVFGKLLSFQEPRDLSV